MSKEASSIIETEDGSQTLISSEFNERYHSIHGARTESEVVFINAGLLEKLDSDSTIHVLEMGFGTGLNALLTLKESVNTNQSIFYVGYEKFPIELNQAKHFRYGNELDLADSFQDLHELPWDQQHQLTPLFTFEKRREDINMITESNRFDVIYFDAFAPAAQEELWTIDLFQKMHSALKADGILVTYCAKGQVKRNLKEVGFSIEPLPGPPGKREMTRARK